MSQHKKNISVKCKILLKNICMIHSYLFLIRYLKFMLKRRTASAGFFSQSGTIKTKCHVPNLRCKNGKYRCTFSSHNT
ncbi:hypothetical protein [Candidatus Tisiphia endosymbiont of Parasteatoda lunata]|uniref:hypothetical protein n=1 Tax=Candidatus Tisiphia endosymbiont of Parasteatoda lunata TaxID=3066275 RepID=UPI00313C938B